jgi:hypothetical protein
MAVGCGCVGDACTDLNAHLAADLGHRPGKPSAAPSRTIVPPKKSFCLTMSDISVLSRRARVQW